MAGRYAKKTRVPVDRTRTEMERTLLRYGANGFGYAWDRRPQKSGEVEERAIITFMLHDRRIQLDVPMPADPAEQRQRWRALLLVIKAKLEAVESGIGTLEAEFLANVVMNDGRTVGSVLLPRLTEVVEHGRLLPGKGDT